MMPRTHKPFCIPATDARKGSRFQLFGVVLYPESESELIEKIKAETMCAWVLHDKDFWKEDTEDHMAGELKKAHVHFVVRLEHGHAQTPSAFAKKYGVNMATRVSVINDELAAVDYLSHKGEDPAEKYVYPEEDVHCENGYVPPAAPAQALLTDDEQALRLLDMPPCRTRKEMTAWAIRNGCWSTYRRSYQIWTDYLYDSHSDAIAAAAE